MEVSIIIVNYNTRELTSNCINSIIRETKDLSYEIIVIDNASNDDSQEYFKNNHQIKFVELPENIGFGRANNVGITHSKGEFLFFLNSDTILLNNAIKIFHDFISQNIGKKIGCIGAMLTDEESVVNGYGGRFPNLMLHLKSYVSVFFSKRGSDFKIEGISSDVDYVLGADMFIPREVINDIGGFDAQFFMYFEESDLQLRMAKKGYSRKIIVGPKIVHLEGKSSFNSIKKLMMVKSSAFKYYKKNRPFIEYVSFRLFSLLDSCRLFFKKEYRIGDVFTYLKFNFRKTH